MGGIRRFDETYNLRNEKMIALYESGVTIKQVAHTFDLSPQRVYQILYRQGAHIRKHQVDTDTTWIKRYQQGQSITQIAQDVGVSPPTIARYLRRANISIRPRGGRNRQRMPSPSLLTGRKTCRTCGKEKPLDEFYALSQRRTVGDGHMYTCKTCHKQRYWLRYKS